MIPIRKGPEPAKLTTLRRKAVQLGLSPEDAYKLLRGQLKRRVRNALVMEQGGLCAYCMCRIPRDDAGTHPPIIIEHLKARNPSDGEDTGQSLAYGNLFAVCHGNRGDAGTRTLEDFVCDAHRRNTEFRKIHPLRPETFSSIVYYMDGSIGAEDADVRFDLVNTLNLNCPTAPQLAERKATLDAFIDAVKEIPSEELVGYCTDILNLFLSEQNQKTPYVGILIWYLQSLLAGLNAT